MKKIIIFIISCFILGCQNNTNQKTVETKDSPNETVEKINLQNDCLLNNCELFNQTEIHIDYLQISMYIKDGKVEFVDELFNSEFIFDDIDNALSLAYNSTCGGDYNFLIACEDKLHQLRIGYRDENFEFSKSNLLSDPFFRSDSIDYDYSLYTNVYSCEDSRIGTTCGNPNFYLEDKNGEKYLVNFWEKEISQTRNDVLPYRQYISISPSFSDKLYIPNYLVWMNDKTFKFIDFDYDSYKENIYPNPLQNPDGETIVAEYAFYEWAEEHLKLYMIEQDGDFYLYEMIFSKPFEINEKSIIKTDKFTEASVKSVEAEKGEYDIVKNITLNMTDGNSMRFDFGDSLVFLY